MFPCSVAANFVLNPRSHPLGHSTRDSFRGGFSGRCASRRPRGSREVEARCASGVARSPLGSPRGAPCLTTRRRGSESALGGAKNTSWHADRPGVRSAILIGVRTGRAVLADRWREVGAASGALAPGERSRWWSSATRRVQVGPLIGEHRPVALCRESCRRGSGAGRRGRHEMWTRFFLARRSSTT